MAIERVSDEVVARAVCMPVHAEELNTVVEPRSFNLHLDSDGQYRWYETGFATDAGGATLRTAIEAARLKWKNFQVIEADGHAVTSESHNDIPERYAADDLERRRKRRRASAG
jgi:hypothetical protein